MVLSPFCNQTEEQKHAHHRHRRLNLRVSGLDDLLATLAAAGIPITTNPAWNTPETGRFARITDPEGNPVELWEPPPA